MHWTSPSRVVLVFVVLLVNRLSGIEAPEGSSDLPSSSLSSVLEKSESSIKTEPLQQDFATQELSSPLEMAPSSTSESDFTLIHTVAPATPKEETEELIPEPHSEEQEQSSSQTVSVNDNVIENTQSIVENDIVSQEIDKLERTTSPEISKEEKQVQESEVDTSTPEQQHDAVVSTFTDADGGQNIVSEREEQNKEDMPSFVEFYKQRMQEEEEKELKKKLNVNGISKGGKVKERKKNNYASTDCGAKVLEHNPEATNPISILVENKDVYMLNPCSANIWFVVELCDLVNIKTIEIANFELFSSTPESFKIYHSSRYPTREWTQLGTFHARDVREVQRFPLEEGVYAKYLKIELLSRFGSEHYCPWSLLRVYGTSMVEEFEDHESNTETDNTGDSNDGDDDEILPIQPGIRHEGGNKEKNILSSATDAVIDFVKKAAKKITGGEDGNSGSSLNETVNGTDLPQDESSTSSSIISTITSIIGSSSMTSEVKQNNNIVMLMDDDDDDNTNKNNGSHPNATNDNTTGSSETPLSDNLYFNAYKRMITLINEDKCTLAANDLDHCLYITPCELLTSILGHTTLSCYMGKILYSIRHYTNFTALAESISMRNDRKVIGRKKKKDIVQKLAEDENDDSKVEQDGVSSSQVNTETTIGETVAHSNSDQDNVSSENLSEESTVVKVQTSSSPDNIKPSVQHQALNGKSQSTDKTPDLAVTEVLSNVQVVSSEQCSQPLSTETVKYQESVSVSMQEPSITNEMPPVQDSNGTNLDSSLTKSVNDNEISNNLEIDILSNAIPEEVNDSDKTKDKEPTNKTEQEESKSKDHVDILEIKLDSEGNEGTAHLQIDNGSLGKETVTTVHAEDHTEKSINIIEEDSTTNELGSVSKKLVPPAGDEVRIVKEWLVNVETSEQTVKESTTRSVIQETHISTTSSAEAIQVTSTSVSAQIKVPPKVPVEMTANTGHSIVSDKLSSELDYSSGQIEEAGTSNGKTLESSTSGGMPNQLSPAQKESIFMRLSNKIKALEMNMTLSNAYMEQLSKKYKKSLEDLQKAFEKRITTLSESSKKADKEVMEQKEEIKNLKTEIEKLSEVVSNLTQQMNSLNKEVMERHVVGMFLQLAFVLLLILFLRRCLPQPHPRIQSQTEAVTHYTSYNGSVPKKDLANGTCRVSHEASVLALSGDGRGFIKQNSEPASMGSKILPTKEKEDFPKPLLHLNQLAESKRKRRKRSKALPTEDSSVSKSDVSDESPSNLISNTAGLLFSAGGMLSTISDTFLPKTAEDVVKDNKEGRRLQRVQSLELYDVPNSATVKTPIPPPPPPPPLPHYSHSNSVKVKKVPFSSKDCAYKADKVYPKRGSLDLPNKHFSQRDSNKTTKYFSKGVAMRGMASNKVVSARM